MTVLMRLLDSLLHLATGGYYYRNVAVTDLETL